jgi:N-acetyl-anhydromuramyl-L-alanine amidase AmpD
MPDGRGWMPGVERIPTPTYGYADMPPGSMQPMAVIDHIAQGYITTLDRWAREGSGQVSAHFGIARTGRIVQYVSIFDPAYHAGRLDYDRQGRFVPPTWPGYVPGSNPNRYTVGIEHEGFSTPPNYGYDYIYDAAHPWPDAMVEASIQVHRWILEQADITPAELTVIGHHELAPMSRANDPGVQWPRKRIMAALGRPEPEPLSPPLTMTRAVHLMTDAFIPGYLARTKTRVTALPMRAGKHVYELEVQERE